MRSFRQPELGGQPNTVRKRNPAVFCLREAAGKFFSYSHRSGVLESQSPACELLRAVERFGRRRRPTVEVTLAPQAAIADHDGLERLADRRGRLAARVEPAARRNRCRTWINPIHYTPPQTQVRLRRTPPVTDQ